MNTPVDLAERLRAIFESPSYCLAYEDMEFLVQDDLRPLRLQLELLKPDWTLQRNQHTMPRAIKRQGHLAVLA